MEIKRDKYLHKLAAKKDNGQIKIITGIRRCGKSYLLFKLYRNYLINTGVSEECIIELALDEAANARYRNPAELDSYIRNAVSDSTKHYYVFIDEIQFVREIENPWLPESRDKITFVDVLLGLMKIQNADIYVTGSNSRMLSKDIVTQFRDRGDEIHLSPLSFAEFSAAYNGNQEDAWREYYSYGGLPKIFSFNSHQEKEEYLLKLFDNTYLKDVIERHDIRNDKAVLDNLIKITASQTGSLSNAKKTADTFKSVLGINVNPTTIERYLEYFEEAFLLKRTWQYDVKGKKYISTPLKYYFSDTGLRNALFGFRQNEENRIMENIIFNELLTRGYSVDIGMVEQRCRDDSGRDIRKRLEVDFIARKGALIYYVQSALNTDTEEKRKQEINPLVKIADSFRKIVVVREHIMPKVDDNGILYIGIRDFLLNDNSLEII